LEKPNISVQENRAFMQLEIEKRTNFFKPKYFVYLPDEGLQGEEIPSNITWENMEVDSIEVAFNEPMKIKEVFNAASYVIKENKLIARDIEVNGYLGLSFETSKVDSIETDLPVQYSMVLKNKEKIELKRNIKLFKPKLSIQIRKDCISVDPKTGFIDGRLNMKNIGRGLLLIRIRSAKNSQGEIKTPPEYQEFAEKFNNDMEKELTALAEEFVQFKPFLTYLLSCGDKSYLDLTNNEKEDFKKSLEGLARLLASDKALLRGFVESFARVLLKNNQFQEVIRKVIAVYQSLVTKDVLLLNPLDEITVEQDVSKIRLDVLLTDNVYDKYKKIELPTISIKAQPKTRVPIYKLVEWG
jgi:hypothetical protein